jgi:hypothetical protein
MLVSDAELIVLVLNVFSKFLKINTNDIVQYVSNTVEMYWVGVNRMDSMLSFNPKYF